MRKLIRLDLQELKFFWPVRVLAELDWTRITFEFDLHWLDIYWSVIY